MTYKINNNSVYSQYYYEYHTSHYNMIIAHRVHYDEELYLFWKLKLQNKVINTPMKTYLR